MMASSESKLCALLVMSVVTLACAQSNTPSEVETETHFLSSCDSSCDDGLSCVCGVCTEACTGDSACEALADIAICAPTPDACTGGAAKTCDVECLDDDGCEELGASYECVSGRCRARAARDNACNTVGDRCCIPLSREGPNYCNNNQLMCGADNTCEVNCDCGVLGAAFPVCGVDGQAYDTTCGRECVPVEIACMGMCPCATSMP